MQVLISQEVTDHFVLSSLFDPADVVVVLLSDKIRRVGTNFLQDGSGNVVGYGKILRVARCAHPAKRAKAQRENVPVAKTEVGELTNNPITVYKSLLSLFYRSSTGLMFD